MQLRPYQILSFLISQLDFLHYGYGKILANKPTSMDTPDIIAIIAVVASLFSIAVAVLAIWLAIVFYRMSSQFSESAREADRRIATSVELLEKLFNTLYSDTFSLVRDTFSDMGKHFWSTKQTDSYDIEAEIEKKTESKMKELKERFDLELSELLQHQTDSRLEPSLPADIHQAVSDALSAFRAVDEEARQETIRLIVLSALDKTRGTFLTANDLWGAIEYRDRGMHIQFPHFYTEIEKMRDEGVLFYDDLDGFDLQPNTMIRKA